MSDQDTVKFIEDAFDTFNAGDMDGLTKIIAEDAQQHIPGTSQFAGDYKSRDEMLGLYAALGAASNGTFQAVLQSAKADGPDRVVGIYKGQGERDGKQLGVENTITFALKDGKIQDIVDTPHDQAAWDAFWG
jgi:uncharacterized protein